MIPVELVGHGIGGRLDLPIPISYFAAGAAVIIIVTFAGLAVLWPRPRLQDGPRAEPMRLRPPVGALGVVGVAGLLLTLAGGLVAWLVGGDAIGSRNFAPLLLWVVFWLMIPFSSAVVGNLYTGLNPWRTLGNWLQIGSEEQVEVESRLGLRLAAVVLFAFTVFELIHPDSALPTTVGLAALIYTTYLLVLMSKVGINTGLMVGDAFTAYNRLLSAISPFGRDRQGRLMWRGWLRALPVLPEWPGLALFVIVMIGTVSYDGLSVTDWWQNATAGWGTVGGILLIAGSVAAIGGGYYLACWLAARLGGDPSPRRVASRFAHTLVPIALAYAFAHYFTLILFEGQQVISNASDPFGLGWDLFGTRDYKINFFLGPTAVWYVQLGAIVAGHVAGVVLAHDRALADFHGGGAVRSQYPMLALMVLLTMLGLFILAG